MNAQQIRRNAVNAQRYTPMTQWNTVDNTPERFLLVQEEPESNLFLIVDEWLYEREYWILRAVVALLVLKSITSTDISNVVNLIARIVN
jgi:hypothetical protein